MLNALKYLVTLLALSSAAPLFAGSESLPATVIDNVTMIDVESGEAKAHRRVVIRGERIESIDDVGAGEIGNVAETIHGDGLYLIPGLIDSHVHLEGQTEASMERALRGGVTSVHVLAGDARLAGNWARRVLAHEVVAPAVHWLALMAGPEFFDDPRVVAASIGHVPGEAPWMQSITADTNIETAVTLTRGTGATGIKLYAALDAAQVDAITAEAHRQGLRVVAHAAVFSANPAELIAAGIDQLSHAAYLAWQGTALETTGFLQRKNAPFADIAPDGAEMDALFDAMAARDTMLEPTLFILGRNPESAVALDWAARATKFAAEHGVPIVAGTDFLIDPAGGPPNLHRELALLVEKAGLNPAQALRAATANAARAMGRETELGTVEAGKLANLVLLAANPLEDIGNTEKIRYVFQRGQVHRIAPAR